MGKVNDLMTELADAVRLKSGATGEMTIKQMVTAMAGITVSGDLGFNCGSFTGNSTGTSVEIEHGLGHAPGAVLFLKLGSAESSIPSSTTSNYYYDALMSIVYGEDYGHAYCYNSIRRTNSGSGNYTTTVTRYWSHSTSIPSTMFGTGLTANSYYVTNISETSFKTPTKLVSGDSYFWIAFRAPLM